jgi:hypothetical protein
MPWSAVYNFFDNNSFSGMFGILLAAVGASHFGFKQYRRQKTYEEIEKRYIHSIDNFLAYLHENRIISETNFGNALKTLQHFRDMEPSFFKEWLKIKNFRNQDISAHMPHSFFVCAQLLGTEEFQKICVRNVVDLSADNEYFISEIPLSLIKLIDSFPDRCKTRDQRKAISDNLAEEIKKRRGRIDKDKLYELLPIIESISFLAKQMNIDTYEKLNEMGKSKPIEGKLAEIKKLFLSIKEEES